MKQITADHRGHIFDEYDICPCCHKGVQPEMIAHAMGEKIDNHYDTLTVIWKCPIKTCKKNVVALYAFASNAQSHSNYKFVEFLNGSPALPIWPDFLQHMENGNPDDPAISESSKFTDIYRQALTAEFKGLNEIAGIGYRRAFEFLVKDFAIMEHPTEKENIMNMLLVSVVKKYFPPEYLPLMERAAWLGNDETHYERKHPDFDLQDLKRVMSYVITDLDGKKQREKIVKTLQPKK